MTETPRIEGEDRDRAGPYPGFDRRMRRKKGALLGLFLSCSLLYFSTRAQPVTSAYGEGQAWAGYGSQSNATLVDLFANGDFSSSSDGWLSHAHAQTSFGLNGAYASSLYQYTAAESGFTPHPTATASYVLSWSTLDHSLSGNILNFSLSSSNSSSVSGLHFGSFLFQYGTPYIIQSSLNVYASYNGGGYALANSVWSDSFTIQGQPEGTSGFAAFDVNLNGSLSTVSSNGPPIYSFPGYPSIVDVITADFSNGASIDYVVLPDGASLITDAGFPATIMTPEPSAGALLLAGCGLLLRRRR